MKITTAKIAITRKENAVLKKAAKKKKMSRKQIEKYVWDVGFMILMDEPKLRECISNLYDD